MAIVITAPNELSCIKIVYPKMPILFLAGSIEMGAAEDWQTKVIDSAINKNWVILNPRRDDWDSSWQQSIHDDNFKQQVDWELDAQDLSNFIYMYVDPNTKSPISLLELGLYASSNKMIVCCPDGFWRKGNVEIVCDRFGIPLLEDLDELIKYDLPCVVW